MNAFQEPKYEIVDGKLVNRQSGEAIPDDEPVFVLRARDQRAANAIAFYLRYLEDGEHRQAVKLRQAQFDKFNKEHPERMKEPDTELTSDWEGYTG